MGYRYSDPYLLSYRVDTKTSTMTSAALSISRLRAGLKEMGTNIGTLELKSKCTENS